MDNFENAGVSAEANRLLVLYRGGKVKLKEEKLSFGKMAFL